MKVLFFCRKMPDLCGAFLHDIDLAIELQNRGHQVVFLTILKPQEGYGGGTYRGFRFLHYTAASSFLETSDIIVTPHSPILPDVRKINSRSYDRPIVATCHFDGNYNAVRDETGKATWSEALFFVNSVMEENYRKNIAPWPRQIARTEVVRPILHRSKIVMEEELRGNCITLINANQNKGQAVFIDMARKMPDQKFLGILPYYGELHVAQAPSNVEWIKFDDDIRNILRRTRILVMPSYYESFGRVAVEAMANGIPVLYSKPALKSQYPGGSTEGMQTWIQPAGVACDRDNTDEWVTAIRELQDPEAYAAKSAESRQHIEASNMFGEASRIATLLESFSREHPVVVKVTTAAQAQQQNRPAEVGRLIQPPVGRPVGVGFANGRLKIQR
jgi:glycosyltransferase involved in cell wall biosynthesis